MQDLEQWFQKSVYDDGVKLYLKYGSDPTLKTMFTREEQSEFKRKKLNQVLSELFEHFKNPTTRKAIIKRQVEQTPAVAHRGWPNPINDLVIQTLYDQAKPLFVELMNLQARIYDVALMAESANNIDKEIEACQMAHRILDLDEQLEEIYAQRDFYLLNNKLPVKPSTSEVVGDPVRWATELQNNERYVRRYRIKLQKDPKNKNAARWAEKLQQAEQKVIFYKKKLKLDNE